MLSLTVFSVFHIKLVIDGQLRIGIHSCAFLLRLQVNGPPSQLSTHDVLPMILPNFTRSKPFVCLILLSYGGETGIYDSER